MNAIKSLFVRKRASDVNMTEGSIVRHIVTFAIPLFVGNLFQMLYNMVDTWVVGNFVNDAAFSAVGTTGSVTNLMIGFFSGFATGTGVLISQFFGAGDRARVKDTVHTAVAFTIVLSVLFTVIGLLLVPVFLMMLGMPENVEAEARTYLIIWFAGMSGLMIYNMAAAIMRAVGDSRRPFIYLMVSAVTNVVLDLVFVLAFGMGVAGVSLATVIAQLVSAILCVITLLRTSSAVRITPGDIRFDLPLLARIAKISFPTAMQMAITSFSNIFIHSYINAFGEYAMGGYTAYSKLDHVVVLPMQSIGLAVSTFVGQNVGKGELKRAAKGANVAFLLSLFGTLILMTPIMMFSEFFASIFNPNPEIIRYASLLIVTMTPFYLFWTVNQTYAGALRGAGKTFPVMMIMLFSFVVFRQIYLFVLTNYFVNDLLWVAACFPFGWMIAAALTIIYYKVVGLKPKEKIARVEEKRS